MTVNDEDINTLLSSELLERRTKVMFLRNAGATWSKIARECGVSEITVRRDYSVVCRDINNEQPADVIARHRAVIFDVQRVNYPAMMRGDKDAAATILRALDREAKLLGLDAPTKVLAGVSDIEFANEAARLIERINTLDPSTLKELERAHATEAANVIDAEVDPAPVAAGDPAPGGGPAQSGDQGGGQPPEAARLEAEVGAVDPQRHPTQPDRGAPAPAGQPDSHAGDVPVPDSDDDWSNIDDD